jgi:hypothetical protein
VGLPCQLLLSSFTGLYCSSSIHYSLVRLHMYLPLLFVYTAIYTIIRADQSQFTQIWRCQLIVQAHSICIHVQISILFTLVVCTSHKWDLKCPYWDFISHLTSRISKNVRESVSTFDNDDKLREATQPWVMGTTAEFNCILL